MHIGKAWTASDRLSTIWKSLLSDKIKRDFFQDIAVSVLLHSYTPWILTKCFEKKLYGTNSNMLCAVLNKSWNLTNHPGKTKTNREGRIFYDVCTPIHGHTRVH